MADKSCLACGIRPIPPRNRYCSRECLKEAERVRTRLRDNGRVKGCKDCGRPNLGQGRKLCNECKEARLPVWKQAEMERSRRRRALAAEGRPPKLCESCGAMELPSYRAKFCDRCKRERSAAKARERRRDPVKGETTRVADRQRYRSERDKLVEAGEVIPTFKDGQKWCSRCSSYKETNAFGRYSAASHGLQRYCKVCNYDYAFSKRLRSVFGLSVDQYDEILERQNGTCAICHQVPRSKRLAVDHDHKTGRVRGLLCTRCNHKLLGAAHDSVELLRSAIDYLQVPPVQESWVVPERLKKKRKKV